MNVMLAQLTLEDPGYFIRGFRVTPAILQTLIVLGSILLVALVIFFWIAWRQTRSSSGSRRHRHRRRHQHHHRHHDHTPVFSATSDDASDETPEEEHDKQADSGSGRHRKQRRPHRPRNPTLAQTGGLPPKRPELSDAAQAPSAAPPQQA